jgi:hypothetical protein
MWKYRGDEKNISGLVGKSQGKRPLGRPKHRSDDHSRMVLKETGLEDVDWFTSGPEQVQETGSFEHGNEPRVP